MTKKTILEWLDELPEPYRTQAININESAECGFISLTEAISGAFDWSKTPEGHVYWKEVSLMCDKREFQEQGKREKILRML